MATVRITEALIREVRQNIDKLFEDRIRQADEAIEQDHDLSLRIFRIFVSEKESEAANFLGTQWVDPHDNFYASINIEAVRQTFTFHLSRKYFMPAKMSVSYHGAEFQIKPSHEPYEELKQKILAYNTLQAERDKLKTGIEETMKRCTTLKQLLVVWPTAIDFMSPMVRERHATKLEKPSQKIEAAKIIMTDDVQVGLIKARMMKT